MIGIRDWLPSFDVNELHQVHIASPPEEALRRALAVPVAPDSVCRMLFRLRGLRHDGTIQEFMTAAGFVLLEHTSTSYVVGLCAGTTGRPVCDAASWRAATGSRLIKAALDFRTEATASGAQLTTETRVLSNGAIARVTFRFYWLIVGPFSALIRRRWLRAAVHQPVR